MSRVLVVLDACIIYSDFFFLGAQSQTLLDACLMEAKTGIELYLPEVIIQETIRNYRERLNKHVETSEKLLSDGRNLIGSIDYPISKTTVPDYVSRYVAFLNALNRQTGVRLVDYPKVDVQAIVEWDIAGKKPFGRRESSAYRDFLIWQTLVGLLESSTSTIAFITNNHHDFAVGPKLEEQRRFHEDLIADLEMRGVDPSRITLYTSLAQFNDEVTKPHLDALDPTYVLDTRFRFLTRIRDIIPVLLEDTWVDGTKVGLSLDFKEPKITDIIEVKDIIVTDVRKLQPNTLLASVEVEVVCTVNAAIERSRWSGVLDRHRHELEYWNVDRNEYYVDVVRNIALHLFLTILIDNSTGRFEEIETQPLTPNGPIRFTMPTTIMGPEP